MSTWRAVGTLALLCGGCDGGMEHAAGDGPALERAAREAGLVGDTANLTGVYAAGDDRVCVTRGAGAAAAYRIGVSVDYGPGQRCIARGTAGGRLKIDLGRGCVFAAEAEGERLTFPTALPAGCARLCQGHATLEALSVERLSAAIGEAARLRDTDGKLLCAS